MDKKGQLIGTAVGDLIVAGALIFILAVMILVVTFIWSHVSAETTLFPSDSEPSQRILAAGNTVHNLLPFAFIIIVAGIYAGLLITAHLARTIPIFAVIGVIVMVITIMISVPISNAYETLADTPELAQHSSRIIEIIMGNLPYLMFILSLSFFIALYAKRPEEDGGRFG